MRRPSRPSLPSKNKHKPKQKKVTMSWWITRIMLETGWTLQQVKQCPIPLFYAMMEQVQEKNKEKSESLGI